MTLPLTSAAVVGGSGLVGTHLLHRLAVDDECTQVVAIGRRPSPAPSPKISQRVADLGDPGTYGDALDVDCVFCTLGTTIKKAGSNAAFRRVDHDYPLAVARAARARGARRFAIVTAVGADATSPIFYNRVKGELEEALRSVEFPAGIRILHPSMLLGARQESRPAERIGAAIMRATAPLFSLGLTKYKAIPAEDVAAALVTAARSDGAGVVVYEGASLFKAAEA
jgi:uncharacterized protein YbjT (DUF2867 family)